MGAVYSLSPILRSPPPDPDRVLAEALDWLEREQRFMQLALGVLAGDIANCRRVLTRGYRGYSHAAYRLAREGWECDCPEPIPPPPPIGGTADDGGRR